jgi:hypothetical protein
MDTVRCLGLHPPGLLGRIHNTHQTFTIINCPDQDLRLHRSIHINNLRTTRLGHHSLIGRLTPEDPLALTRITIDLMGRVTMGLGMNVVTDHHEAGEGDPNQAVGEEEAVDEIRIGEGTEIETGEIDREIPVGQREAEGEVVLDGVNTLGHESFFQSKVVTNRFVRPRRKTFRSDF